MLLLRLSKIMRFPKVIVSIIIIKMIIFWGNQNNYTILYEEEKLLPKNCKMRKCGFAGTLVKSLMDLCLSKPSFYPSFNTVNMVMMMMMMVIRKRTISWDIKVSL